MKKNKKSQNKKRIPGFTFLALLLVYSAKPTESLGAQSTSAPLSRSACVDYIRQNTSLDQAAADICITSQTPTDAALCVWNVLKVNQERTNRGEEGFLARGAYNLCMYTQSSWQRMDCVDSVLKAGRSIPYAIETCNPQRADADKRAGGYEWLVFFPGVFFGEPITLEPQGYQVQALQP